MATYSVWQSFITDGGEKVVPSAEITVYLESSGAVATLYSTETGTVLANPFTAGADGFAQFFAPAGVYKVAARKDALEKSFRFVQLGTAASRDAGEPGGVATLDASGQLVEPSPSEVITESGTSRTLALIDAGKYINCTAGTAVTITIPLNATAAFPIWTEIDVWQDGAGVVSFVGAVGVTIHSVGLSLAAQYRAATLKKVGTDTWHIIGALV